ncbi:MAG: (R)-citramalate synthase, partial [uncultured Quadrisphaera sp.]
WPPPRRRRARPPRPWTSTTPLCATARSRRASPCRWPTSCTSRRCWPSWASATSRAAGPARSPRTRSSSPGRG